MASNQANTNHSKGVGQQDSPASPKHPFDLAVEQATKADWAAAALKPFKPTAKQQEALKSAVLGSSPATKGDGTK